MPSFERTWRALVLQDLWQHVFESICHLCVLGRVVRKFNSVIGVVSNPEHKLGFIIDAPALRFGEYRMDGPARIEKRNGVADPINVKWTYEIGVSNP